MPCEDSDLPEHLHSLTESSLGAFWEKFLYADNEDSYHCTDKQADLNLHCALMYEDTFSSFMAHIVDIPL